MSHKDYIKNLINLQDNTLEITDVDLVDEDNIKYFNISIVRNKQFLPKCCKYCGSISIISHGSTSRKIKYLPFANISSNIIYTQKRFLCKDCGKTFNDECSIVCKNGTISNAVKNSILEEFKSVVLTYKSWIKEITNSFLFDPVTKKRITNRFIEGKNNFYKVIKRVGFGYKNFDLFRARVLYISNNKKDKNNEKIK